MLGIPDRVIARTELTSTASSVTISNIDTLVAAIPWNTAHPARHLVVRVQARSSSPSELKIRFNADSGNNYNRQMLRGAGSAAAAFRASNQDGYIYGSLVTTANIWGGGELLIPDAFSTRSHKSLISLTGPGEVEVTLFAGRWAITAIITSVTILPTAGSFEIGSVFEVAVVDEMFAIPGAETILT